MSGRTATRLAQLAGLALALGTTAHAAEPVPAAAGTEPATRTTPAKPALEKPVSGKDLAAELAADDELLEFLGGADGELDEDGDWLDFLATTDIRKVAGAKR